MHDRITRGARVMMVAAGLCLSLGSGTVAAAEDQSIPAQIGTKFVRGSANIATGWVEIPKQIYLVGKREGWVQGAFRGPLEGFGMFIARTVAGAYEVLTFPIPLPSRYQPMLLPDYVWQEEPAGQLAVPTEPAAPMIKPDDR